MWVTGGGRRRVNQENPPMRIYIIGNDGIMLCREAPATVNEGEIAVVSNAELHAAPLFADSPLEGDGFELSVPGRKRVHPFR